MIYDNDNNHDNDNDDEDSNSNDDNYVDNVYITTLLYLAFQW